MTGRTNCFDELRLLGAVLVALSHSYNVAGLSSPEVNGRSFAMMGLFIFFGVSGYLVSASFERDDHIVRFMAKRALRIFPALIAMLLVTTLIIGPIFSADPGYFSSIGTWYYLVANSLLAFTPSLPGVFATNQLPYAVNNSLWTLHVEFILYTLTPILVVFTRTRWIAWPLLIVGAIFACTMTPEATGWQIWFRAIPLVGCFIMGAALNRLRLAQMGTIAVLAAIYSVPIPALLPAAIVLASIALGEVMIPEKYSVSRIGDLSYGIYLSAFPVQQGVAQLTNGGPLINLAATMCCITPFALLSWQFIEKPALRLKPMPTASLSRRNVLTDPEVATAAH